MGEFKDEERLKTQIDAFNNEDRLKTQAVEAESFRGIVIDEVQMGQRNSGIAVTFNSRNSNKSKNLTTKNSDIAKVAVETLLQSTFEF